MGFSIGSRGGSSSQSVNVAVSDISNISVIRDYNFTKNGNSSVTSSISHDSPTASIDLSALSTVGYVAQKSSVSTGSITLEDFTAYDMFNGIDSAWFSCWVFINSSFPNNNTEYYIARFGNTSSSKFDFTLKQSSGVFKAKVFCNITQGGSCSYTKNVLVTAGGWNHFVFTIDTANNTFNVYVNDIAGTEVGDSLAPSTGTIKITNIQPIFIKNATGELLFDSIGSLSYGRGALTTADRGKLRDCTPLGDSRDVKYFHIDSFYGQTASPLNHGDYISALNNHTIIDGDGISVAYDSMVSAEEAISQEEIDIQELGAKKLVITISDDSLAPSGIYGIKLPIGLIGGLYYGDLLYVKSISGAGVTGIFSGSETIRTTYNIQKSSSGMLDPTGDTPVFCDNEYIFIGINHDGIAVSGAIEIWVSKILDAASLIYSDFSQILFSSVVDSTTFNRQNFIYRNGPITRGSSLGITETNSDAINLSEDFSIYVSCPKTPVRSAGSNELLYSIICQIGADTTDNCVLIERSIELISMTVKSTNTSTASYEVGVDVGVSTYEYTNDSNFYNILFRFNCQSGVIDVFCNGAKVSAVTSKTGVPGPITSGLLSIGSQDATNFPTNDDQVRKIRIFSGSLSDSSCKILSALR